MQTPPPLRSGLLDIKVAQYAKDGRKIAYHIISRLGAMDVQKGRFGRPKIQFTSIVSKFAVKIGIDLSLIFHINDFFVRFLLFEI